MQDILDDYISAHTSEEPEILRRLYRHTHLHHLYPRMCSGHVQGRLLKMFTSMVNPDRVLELGSFTGYSALCMAECMRPGAELHTVEVDDELEDELTELFERADTAARITLHIGDALDVVPTLGGVWDMVYIDANKRNYTDYFEMVLPLVKPGGFIIADNTLWGGKVAEIPAPNDAQSRGIMDFNDRVARDSRVETVIVPVRDGLTLIRKISG